MNDREPQNEKARKAGAAGSGGSFVPLTSLDAVRRLDLAAVRQRLAGARGRQYWRSLEEVADTEEFQEYLRHEFPRQAPREMEPVSRREFFRVMGATLALAGVGGCALQPAEKIAPYVQQPEQLVLGKPNYYATAYQHGGYAVGVLAESHQGRPTKIEGNPQHPASLGATDVFAQGSLLTLYDPDRSQTVRFRGNPDTWDSFLGQFTTLMQTLRASGGAGLRVLCETVTSPTLASQLGQLLKTYPSARVHVHEPAGREQVAAGAKLAFGADAHPVYHFDRATTIVSLDSDFLVDEPGSVRYARDFADGRRVRKNRTTMNRLYVAETTVSLTGANADHRLPVGLADLDSFARALATAVGVTGITGNPPNGPAQAWVTAVSRDLQANRGKSLVIAGPHTSPALQALAHAMNHALGNVGATVTYTAPVEAAIPNQGTLADLVRDMTAGAVNTLLILGSNPVYTAPADLDFAKALQHNAIKNRIHLGLYDDETGIQCEWHLPESHYLEAWSDSRAYDGTVSIVQPLILPIYETFSAHELLAYMLNPATPAQSRAAFPRGYEVVRNYWKTRLGGDFEAAWNRALVAGTVPNTAAPAISVTPVANLGGSLPAPAAATGADIIFRPDPSVFDGRYANNGWLQELPQPLTSLTWDNAALVSPKMAEELALANGDLVDLAYKGRTVKAAVWITPGHPEKTVTLHLGYGRTHAGKVAEGSGFNAYALRTSDALGGGSGLEVKKDGGQYKLAAVQHHHSVEGRDLIRVGTIGEYIETLKKPDQKAFAPEDAPTEAPHTLYPNMWPSDQQVPPGRDKTEPYPNDPEQIPKTGYNGLPVPAWGMVIDLGACIGCNACTIACQAENNIATVGKDQVAIHREMHWIRVDNYYVGDNMDNPDSVFQPVPCMHCEDAPCELVCPVEATSHSAEGINEMTYNRCIGTRYCSNNCPYKVRRFNYLQFSDQKTPTMQMMRNPDVTVRSRGVMEKCNYCVQRVNEARIQAEKEDRPIRDGDVVTACAQVCPTAAITFGDLKDMVGNSGKGSRVQQLTRDPLNFGILTELNTRPRTSYMARVRNPNPELAHGAAAQGAAAAKE